jgi:FkbM family methyltransferase
MGRDNAMKYDFIEIGTSNFDTLLQSATDTTVGLSIEPIKYYLDCLPDCPGVKKLNCAASRSNKRETLQVYYVPENVIQERNLPDWLKGCNSVGGYHFQHQYLNITDLVVTDSVPCIPIGEIFEENNVTAVDYLKIDTEGSDSEILLHLYEYLKHQDSSHYPKKILFESNELSLAVNVELVKQKYITLGYSVTSAGYDSILEFKN